MLHCGGGVGSGPSGERGGHVPLGSLGTVVDGDLPGQRAPGIVKLAKFG